MINVTTRVHYAWVVAGVAFLALVMASGFRSVTGVLLLPLHDEFGWSHETIGLAVSLNLLCFGLGRRSRGAGRACGCATRGRRVRLP